jgi:hypothetical protein
MQLTVSSFYSEVGVSFEISHKVDLYIRSLFIDKLMGQYGLTDRDRTLTLNLNVTTTKGTLKAEARGPVVDKKE